MRKKANKIKELVREDRSVVVEEELTNYVLFFFQDLFTSMAATESMSSLTRLTQELMLVCKIFLMRSSLERR